MRIAITAPFYLPAVRAGGPVPGVRGVIDTLDGHEVWVFTSDRDLGATEPYPAPYTGTSEATGSKVTYLGPLRPQRLRDWLQALRSIRRADLVYVNSWFSAPFTLLPILLLKATGYRGRVAISPRGELAASALRLGNTKLKASWLALTRLLRLWGSIGRRNNAVWLASSEHEASDIKHAYPAAQVAICPERLRPSAGPIATPRAPGQYPMRVISVGRLAPVKGMLELVRAAALVRHPLQLTLVGLEEDADYVRNVRAAAESVPDHVQIRFAGALEPGQLREALADSDLFVLLTHGENFGHAIGEALQTGLPIVISDQTPWGFAAEVGAGRLIPGEDLGEAAQIAGLLDGFATMDLARRQHAHAAALSSAQHGIIVEGQQSLLEAVSQLSSTSRRRG